MSRENKKQRIERYVKAMKENVGDGDFEIQHGNADGLFCKLLREIGYDEVVDVWLEVNKWYA